jgi:hypothetical protein
MNKVNVVTKHLSNTKFYGKRAAVMTGNKASGCECTLQEAHISADHVKNVKLIGKRDLTEIECKTIRSKAKLEYKDNYGKKKTVYVDQFKRDVNITRKKKCFNNKCVKTVINHKTLRIE